MTISEQIVYDRELTIERCIETLLELQEEHPSITIMETITTLEEIKGARC